MRWHHLITITSISSVLAMSSAVWAAEATATYEQSFPVGTVSQLELKGGAGDVEIVPAGDGRISIHAIRKVTGTSENQCEEELANLQVRTKQGSQSFTIDQTKVNHNNYLGSIEYSIAIPPELAIRISSGAGNIACRDRLADVRCETESGDIELANCHGVLYAKTEGGDITVDGVTSDGRFESKTGNLDLFVGMERNARVRAETREGSVKVRLPGDVSTMVAARTDNGRVTSGDFASALTLSTTRSYASGKLGSGEGSLIVNTKRGSIDIDTYRQELPPPPPLEVSAPLPPRTIVENRYVTYVESSCYPRFRHFRHHNHWGPAVVIGIPPVRISFGSSRPHHGWNPFPPPHRWDRHDRRYDHREARHDRRDDRRDRRDDHGWRR